MHNREAIKARRAVNFGVVPLVLCLLVSTLAFGQRRSNQVKMETGLFDVFPGQTVVISLTSTRRETPRTAVRVRLLDSHEAVLAEDVGQFFYGEPFSLEVDWDSISNAPLRMPVRVQIVLNHPATLTELSAIATVETENRSIGQSFTSVICPVPSGPDGGRGGPVLFSCGPCKCEIGGFVTPR